MGQRRKSGDVVVTKSIYGGGLGNKIQDYHSGGCCSVLTRT